MKQPVLNPSSDYPGETARAKFFQNGKMAPPVATGRRPTIQRVAGWIASCFSWYAY